MKYSLLLALIGMFSFAQASEMAFSCRVARYEGSRYSVPQHAHMTSSKPTQVIDLDYGLTVKLDKIDSARLLISIYQDGVLATQPTIVDSKQTTHLIVEAKSASVNCVPQVEQN